MGLEEMELDSLFRDCDVNGDGAVSYNEFVKQFTAINTTQITKRMRRILYGASISAEYVFNKHCKGLSISRPEFHNLLSSLIEKLAPFETDSIFYTLDRRNQGAIQKQEFLDWFGYDEEEKMFQTGIEDIIKPLVTCMARKDITVNKLFAKYDANKNMMMSASELQAALKELL